MSHFNASIVTQVRRAAFGKNRLAAALALLFGGFIPAAGWYIAHFELDPSQPLWTQRKAYLVLAALVFSSLSVVTWASKVFANPVEWITQAKAVGFTVLLEGVASMSEGLGGGLSVCALLIIVFINTIACTNNLTAEHRSEGDERDSRPSGGDTLGLGQLMRQVPAPAPTLAPTLAPAPVPAPTVHRARPPRRKRPEAPALTPEQGSLLPAAA